MTPDETPSRRDDVRGILDPNPTGVVVSGDGTELHYLDPAGDLLLINTTRDHLVFATSEGTDVVVPRDAVRDILAFCRGWLGDIDVTSLDKPPGSEFLPGVVEVMRCGSPTVTDGCVRPCGHDDSGHSMYPLPGDPGFVMPDLS